MPETEKIITSSPEETFELGMRLGRKAEPGAVYALHGGLGAGKTVLAKGIAAGLGVSEDVTSPTFTLLEIYEARIPLYHFDLYRIENLSEFDNLFFEEYWEGDGVSVIEWAERAAGLLPDCTVNIFLESDSENERSVKIEYPGN
jgi:tRNA threonylcarbamoyladenosine biosynthesis protein TsaE